MITLPEVSPLTVQEIAVLQAVVRQPSTASCPRYPREIVAQLVERRLAKWQTANWFKNTDSGIACYENLYMLAVARLQRDGWRVRQTTGGVRGVVLISPTTGENQIYLDEQEAWESLLTPALLAEVQS